MPDFLSSPDTYQSFLYSLPEQYPWIHQSNLAYIPTGNRFGRVEGALFFIPDLVLCIQEFLNFELGVIEAYGYELSRTKIPFDSPDFPTLTAYCKASFSQKEKLYWYDSFPHPHILELASTNPHHKHIHPNIKRNRIPAPDISFTRPNLPFLLAEIKQLL